MKNLLSLAFSLLLTVIAAQGQSRLNFDGFGDYVHLGGVDFPPPWTAEMLVLKNQTSPYSHLLTSTDGTSGLRLEQYINNNRVGVTKAGIADWTFNYQLPVGEWKHLAFVCDGATIKLYVNGQQTGGNINGTINMPMDMIGLNTTGAGALNAEIDELRIWNTALPESSISAYMFDTIPAGHPQYNHLVSYYRFDEGGGNTAFDSKGSLDGTIYGATYEQVFARDLAVAALVDPPPFSNDLTDSETVTVRIANAGLLPFTEDFEVGYSLNGGPATTETVYASVNPIGPFSSIDVTFPAVDLSFYGTHTFEIFLQAQNDQNSANNTLVQSVSENSISLGDITAFDVLDGEYIITSFNSKVKVVFYRHDVFRIWLAPGGAFFEPAADHIVVPELVPLESTNWSDHEDYYIMESDEVILRAYKSPLRFAMYKKDNATLIWEESAPLSFGETSRQRISRGAEEHYFGCGMQNGYFSHRDRTVKIENVFGDWGDGTTPNPAPFYMSTAGYGAFRNTFARGEYQFLNPAELMHRENHFDCFYFYGPSLKEVLEGYTYITGRPFMIPRWGMEFGDADCYNDTGTTADVIGQIAQVYRNLDMPGGWILPNDGYGCGYENLEYVVDELDNLGFYTGLWTEDGVGNIEYEVGTAGTRCVKLDVALVGPGYLSAMQSGKAAFQGIETYSDARGYIWTVAGWAGTHRFATIWSGDQYGTFENIRFHIPTVIGAGLSAFNCATGDIDGIFGGSASTYTRDLQWKCFTPAMMTISGWAPQGKQPWAFGGNFTNYNRKYLKLKMRLTPYLYSYSREAHETGVPTVRAMVLEFPDDPVTWGDATQYQFMSGEWFLVAPVYQNSLVRNGIYLPEGAWIDYWDGTRYEGPMTLNGYLTTLDKLPLFVKAGAIVPMYPEMLHDREKPKDPITFDIYPRGQTSFSLYEDDGYSQEYRDGAFAETLISVNAPETGFDQPVTIQVGPTAGTYAGRLDSRRNVFEVHFGAKPSVVKLDGQPMQEYPIQTEWEAAEAGWHYDPADRGGIVFVKTQSLPVEAGFEISLEDFVSTVETFQEEITVVIFPNPATNRLVIQTGDRFRPERINLYDLTGKLLKTVAPGGASPTIEIELTPEMSGTILVELTAGKRTVVRKVVVR